MREILFRGKSVINGEWHYGFYVPRFHDCIIHSGVFSNDYELVKPDTVGQYTGLTDKNGVRIFEGDIVKTKYSRLCEVRWFSSPCTQCWDLIPIEATQKSPDSYDVWASKNLEVVGNVHDGGAYD